MRELIEGSAFWKAVPEEEKTTKTKEYYRKECWYENNQEQFQRLKSLNLLEKGENLA